MAFKSQSGISVQIDIWLTVPLESANMNDWLDALTDGIKKADESERKKEDHEKYILHRADVLKRHGPAIWKTFVDSCQRYISQLNHKIGVRFPGEGSKQIEWLSKGSLVFSLCGKTPSFSLDVTYQPDHNHISISGSRHIDGGIEGRHGLLVMELDSDGNPCLANVEHQPITMEIASRYLLELGLATSRPPSPGT